MQAKQWERSGSVNREDSEENLGLWTDKEIPKFIRRLSMQKVKNWIK